MHHTNEADKQLKNLRKISNENQNGSKPNEQLDKPSQPTKISIAERLAMLQKKPNESVKESAPNKPGMIKPSLINQNQQAFPTKQQRPVSGLTSKPDQIQNTKTLIATNTNAGNNKINSLLNNLTNANIGNNKNSSINSNNNQITISNNNETNSTLSIKDRLKLLNGENTSQFPMPGINKITNANKPLNNPIQFNHNFQSSHLNKLNEEDKIKSKQEEIKKEEAKTKTKEEIEEEKRLKRERMKLKMGNSTNKIISKNNSEKEKEAEKLKEQKNENNKVKNLANMLADKIHFAPAAKGQFENINSESKINKLNKLFKGNDDIQYENEEQVIDDDEDDCAIKPSKNNINNTNGNTIKLNENSVESKKPISNSNLEGNIDNNNSNNDKNIMDEHQKNLDDEDYFMKQIENKPRMMTTVKKFKKPGFKLEN